MNKLLWESFIEPLGTDSEKNKISQMLSEILKTNTGKKLFERLKHHQKRKKISICFSEIKAVGTYSHKKQCIKLRSKKINSVTLAHELVHVCQLEIQTFSSIKTYAIAEKLSELEALIYEIIIFYELSRYDRKRHSSTAITRAGSCLYQYLLKIGRTQQQARTELAKIFWTNNVADVNLPSRYKIAKEVDTWNELYNEEIFFKTKYHSFDNKKPCAEKRILNSLIKPLQINLTQEFFLNNGIYIHDMDKLGSKGYDTPCLGTRFVVCDDEKRIVGISRFNAGRFVALNVYKKNQLDYCINFHLNGNRKKELYYKDGKLEGVCNYYNIKGKIESKRTYKDGKLNGLWAAYFPNGRIKSKCMYTDDEIDGVWKSYSMSGKIENKRTYKDGKLNGLWTAYFPNGKIKYEWLFKDDQANGCVTNYREDGTIHDKGFFLNGVENGMHTYYRKDGQTIDFMVPIINGETSGMQVAYYEDGKTVEITTAFQNNKRNGPRTYYKRNGQVDHIEIYRDDRLITKK